jgi:cobalt-zinc-cadmium efflux system protein
MHDENDRREVAAGRPLKIVLVIVLMVMVAEVIGGIYSNSLALISDAGHMLTDALALGLSLVAFALARRPATPTRTYGYHRAEIMAALANGTVLILVSAYIFYRAYQRFFVSPEVEAPLMLVTAAIGLSANLVGILVLRRSRHGSLNIKAAFWHIIGDTLSSMGVIIAGIIILITDWYIVDPILAVVIGCVILWGAFRIVREAVDILLESVPAHVRIEDVTDSIKGITGVKDLHDVHIWTITSGIYALSAHVNIEDQMVSESNNIVARVNELLAGDFNITHTTLQLECGACATGLVCNLPRAIYTNRPG